MNDWLAALHQRLVAGKPCVRVVVANVIGSTPREVGAAMLIGADDIEGTIGGGHLEWNAIDIARNMLAQPQLQSSHVERLLLGAMLGQCCGGAVELWFERYNANDTGLVADILSRRGKDILLVTTSGNSPERQLVARSDITAINLPQHFDAVGTLLLRTKDNQAMLVERINASCTELWLFGAGHVGKALVKILADLPLRITWVDSRAELLPADLPHNITPLCTDEPVDAVRIAPANAWYLVLTHSHDLDYALCRAVLARADFSWLGLIGSHTKATHFRNRLQRSGITGETIARMVCPIGLLSVGSKLPAAIAISVAAQLLTLLEQQQRSTTRSSLGPTHDNRSSDSIIDRSTAVEGAPTGTDRHHQTLSRRRRQR